MNRFFHLNKLLNRYNNGDDVDVGMIVNRIIILHNLFGFITPKLLLFKTKEHSLQQAITVLKYLNLMPNIVDGVDYSEYPVDQNMNEKLKEI